MIGASGDQGAAPLASRGEVAQAVLCFCAAPSTLMGRVHFVTLETKT